MQKMDQAYLLIMTDGQTPEGTGFQERRVCHSSAGVMMHVFQPGFCAQVMCPTKRGVASGWSQTARARRVCNRAGDVAGISWISRPVYRVFRSILQCLRGMQQGNPLCGQYWRTHCLLDAGISGHIWQKAVIRQSMRVLSFLCKRLASAICRVFLKNDTTSSVFLCIRGIVAKLLPSTDGFQRSCGSLSAA